MPELPEVEIITRAMRQLKGYKFSSGGYSGDWWPRCLEKNGTYSDVRGRRIRGVRRRGKFIIFDLGKKELIISLGMTGSLTLDSRHGKNERVQFHLKCDKTDDKGRHLFYCDARGFGSLKLVTKGDYSGLMSKMGSEPLNKSFTNLLDTKLSSKKPIKSILLDQHFIAGIGNYLADEILFDARINPNRSANSLSLEEIQSLKNSTQKICYESIKHGGNSFSDYVHADGSKGGYYSHMKAYGREGELCNYGCGYAITKIKLGGRGTHFCSLCQK